MAQRGGRRSTSGQGRPKGVPNKATARREAEVAASGLTPLGYMLKVLRDDTETAERRMWAAQTAGPYVHPRLNAINHSGSIDLGVHAWLLEASGAIAGELVRQSVEGLPDLSAEMIDGEE